ncbi:MAG: signal peptidase I, partial [Verrucomicrobiota bacterium]
DVLSGDALFVDRFSYHFFRPETGDPIVFRAGGISGPNGQLGDKYYIKRLGGSGGETLAIDEPILFIDGEAATQNEAFVKNNEEIDGYRGYVSGWPGMSFLDPGTTFTVPENELFALGDNSRNSQDSRYFGSFDQDRVIGRALFIYYPFTKRWGPAD